MSPETIDIWRKKALEIFQTMPRPAFYCEREKELSRVEEVAGLSGNVLFAQSLIREQGGALGHGYGHASRVAIESGAVIYCEAGFGPKSDMLVENCLIAGYLHDIRRDEKDHPGKAAEFVRETFRGKIPDHHLDMITFAIQNHEAFKQFELVPDGDFMLMADALYDADKFRWGPDNFVYTIWDMAESMKMNPAILFKYYDKGIEGIVRVKNSFRTGTGRKYGPDFIDKGLEIGRELLEFYRAGVSH